MFSHYTKCHVFFEGYLILTFILQDNTKFKQALKIRNPKNRLKRIYDACKTKKVCGEGDDLDVQQQQDTDEHVNRRGGCGAQQPIITVDGVKMLVEFKAPKKKNDDQEQLSELVEPKQILSAERVFI
jgi:DNA-directed RNA polymerase II subunit RPB1